MVLPRNLRVSNGIQVEYVEYRPPDPREIDDELRMARQLRQEPADMRNDAEIRCSKRYALEMPDLKDRRVSVADTKFRAAI